MTITSPLLRHTICTVLALLLVSNITIAAENVSLVGQVVRIDYIEKTMTLVILESSQNEVSAREQQFTVDFDTSKETCIDWRNERNRNLSAFFGLGEGDIIAAEVLNLDKISRLESIEKITTSFYKEVVDSGKLYPPELIELFANPGMRADVVVSLTPPEQGRENTPPALYATLSVDDFIFTERAQNTPIISGQMSLSGLVKFTRSPEVLSIEQNLDMELLVPAGEITQ